MAVIWFIVLRVQVKPLVDKSGFGVAWRTLDRLWKFPWSFLSTSFRTTKDWCGLHLPHPAVHFSSTDAYRCRVYPDHISLVWVLSTDLGTYWAFLSWRYLTCRLIRLGNIYWHFGWLRYENGFRGYVVSVEHPHAWYEQRVCVDAHLSCPHLDTRSYRSCPQFHHICILLS